MNRDAYLECRRHRGEAPVFTYAFNHFVEKSKSTISQIEFQVKFEQWLLMTHQSIWTLFDRLFSINKVFDKNNQLIWVY